MRKTRRKTEQEVRYMQMINNIQQAKKDLDCAYLNFEHATEPDLIDCYIYQLKSRFLEPNPRDSDSVGLGEAFDSGNLLVWDRI